MTIINRETFEYYKKRKNLTNKAIADGAGVDERTVGKIKKNGDLNASTVERIAAAMDKTVEDVFLNKSNLKIFRNLRRNTKNTHGTGCTLSSAITTFFSCGKSIIKACDKGIKYVNSAILTNPKYGKGHGPINHLNSIKIEKRYR